MAGSVMDLVDAVEHISYFNGSAGWCAMIGGTTGLNAGFLDPAFGSELFAAPNACGGGLAAPAGVATITDGGLNVTGEWAWGSGTSHCTTIAGGVRVVDSAGERAKLSGGSTGCFAFFDLEDVELLDTWNTSGLRGTGSTNYRVHGAFVPEGRWVSLAEPATPVDDNPLYRFSAFGALSMGVTAVLMGLGRRAVDELIALGDKRGAGSKRTLAERAVVQAELARADAAVRSSRAFVESVVGQCWEAASEGAITDEHRALLRLAATDAANRCKTAVDLCYHAAGGTSVYKTNSLERVFRDAHVATQHIMVAERVLEPLGRMRFGLPTSTAQF
jgi:alkylation response protein AidB-like acyl-CoA dehydrogenase